MAKNNDFQDLLGQEAKTQLPEFTVNDLRLLEIFTGEAYQDALGKCAYGYLREYKEGLDALEVNIIDTYEEKEQEGIPGYKSVAALLIDNTELVKEDKELSDSLKKSLESLDKARLSVNTLIELGKKDEFVKGKLTTLNELSERLFKASEFLGNQMPEKTKEEQVEYARSIVGEVLGKAVGMAIALGATIMHTQLMTTAVGVAAVATFGPAIGPWVVVGGAVLGALAAEKAVTKSVHLMEDIGRAVAGKMSKEKPVGKFQNKLKASDKGTQKGI